MPELQVNWLVLLVMHSYMSGADPGIVQWFRVLEKAGP